MSAITQHTEQQEPVFPFESRFSLEILINKWRNLEPEEAARMGCSTEQIEQWLAEVPELTHSLQGVDIVEKHRDIVLRLVHPIFSESPWGGELKIISPPFIPNFVFISDNLRKAVKIGPKVIKRIAQKTHYLRTLYAYRIILRDHYSFPVLADMPVVYPLPSAETGLDMYFRIHVTDQFMRCVAKKPLPKLTKANLEELIQDHQDLERWMELLPPENFSFEGFALQTLVDVTSEEATEEIKHYLLEESKLTESRFNALENELRVFLRKPDIHLGLASVQGNGELNLFSRQKIWNSLSIREFPEIAKAHLSESAYGRLLSEKKPLMIPDLGEMERPSPVEKALLERDIRNLVLLPLVFQKKLVGVLELTSEHPGEIDSLSTIKLNQVTPIFSLAVHQNLERFEHRVEDIIKEAYTAIHPTVAWRFREAAINLLDMQEKAGANETVKPEPIVFEKVYPLYGATDIRGSSNERNKAIQEDLISQLKLAQQLIRKARKIANLTILDELSYEVEEAAKRVAKGLNTGEETSVMEYLQKEVAPLLNHLGLSIPELKEDLGRYFGASPSQTGIFEQHRREYESSLRRINDTLSRMLDQDQVQSQKIFPHYFEKYQTDGVEHNLYIGDSLAKNRGFFPVYLKNLRLRQMILTCEAAREINRIRSELPVALDVTHLILVHSSPMTISFRQEEKKFDVDGAYNIRYEIVKKRIDKALVKGTLERLTQPGKIVIIYSLDKEAEEYYRYIDYLQSRKYLLPQVENLEVEALQGVQGLKALRVTINLSGETNGEGQEEEIRKVLEEQGG